MTRRWTVSGRARLTGTCGATRSGAYMRWRYERASRRAYCFALVWRDRRFLGYRSPCTTASRLDDFRVATGLAIGSIVDLVLDPDCRAALPQALRVARRWRHEPPTTMRSSSPASHNSFRGPILRAGYFKARKYHLLLRDKGANSASAPTWVSGT